MEELRTSTAPDESEVYVRHIPAEVKITEVGLRDGLQSEAKFVPTERKIALASKLIDAGVQSLEVTSFVSPRAVPQMSDAADLMAALSRYENIELTALTPNAKGAQRAIEAGVSAMVFFMSATESHNQKNLNCSREKSLENLSEIASLSEASGIPVYATLSTAFGCPFEGEVLIEDVTALSKSLKIRGVKRISLGDTTGMAHPRLVEQQCRALIQEVPGIDLALHFHNTRGLGIACTYAGLLAGATQFEASIGGLGGCPFAPDATGNVCTEDLVYLFEESGINTGCNLERLVTAAQFAQDVVGYQLPGQVMKAGPRLKTYDPSVTQTAKG